MNYLLWLNGWSILILSFEEVNNDKINILIVNYGYYEVNL